MSHVAYGVDVDQETDTGDDKNHDAGKRIEEKAPVGNEANDVCSTLGTNSHRAGSEPFEHDLLGNAKFGIGGEQLNHSTRRINERQTDAADAERANREIRETLAEKEHERRRCQRKQRDQPEMAQEITRGRHAVFDSSFISSRYHFSKSISSAKTVSRFRKNAMM